MADVRSRWLTISELKEEYELEYSVDFIRKKAYDAVAKNILPSTTIAFYPTGHGRPKMVVQRKYAEDFINAYNLRAATGFNPAEWMSVTALKSEFSLIGDRGIFLKCMKDAMENGTAPAGMIAYGANQRGRPLLIRREYAAQFVREMGFPSHNDINRDDWIGVRQLLDEYNLGVPYRLVLNTMHFALQEKILPDDAIRIATSQAHNPILLRRIYIQTFLETMHLLPNVDVNRAEWISVEEIISENNASSDYQSVRAKLKKFVNKYNLGADAFIYLSKVGHSATMLLNRKHLAQFVAYAHLERWTELHGDGWVSGNRLRTEYNATPSRSLMDRYLRDAYRKNILPSGALKLVTDVRNPYVMIRRDYVPEFMTRMNIPTRDGFCRGNYLNVLQICREMSMPNTMVANVRAALRRAYNNGLFPADAFQVCSDGRGSGISLRRDYLAEFINRMNLGAKAISNRDELVTVQQLQTQYNINASYDSLSRLLKYALRNNSMSRGAIVFTGNVAHLRRDCVPELIAKMDMSHDVVPPRRELFNAMDLRREYKLTASLETLGAMMLSAPDEYILPSDAIIVVRNVVYMRRKYADEFIEKMDLRHHSR